MPLTKVIYTDGVTVIHADNLNAIQDAIIALEGKAIPGLSSLMPENIGIPSAGTSADAARADHTHDFAADFKAALLQLAEKVAYIDGNGAQYYADLESALTHRTLSSISAVYTQRGTVYTHDTLDSLKADLVVTAAYDNSTTATIPADEYTLSGTLTAGTSTITVSYNGQTTTFTVTVTAGVPNTYGVYDYIKANGSATISNVSNAMWIALKQYDNLNALSVEFAAMRLSAFDGLGAGPAVFGRRSESGAAKSFAFYPKAGELGYHLHGDEGTNSPAFITGRVNIVKYTNTSASPSSLQVDENTPKSITWSNNDTLNLAPVLLMNPTNNTSDNMNAYCRIGYIKFFDLSNNLVGYYIPVVRISDKRIGMYDVVDQTFYTSSTASYTTLNNTNCKYEIGRWS